MRLRFPPLLLVLPALAGCAAPAPRSPDDRPPASLDEALGRLDRAEADLARLGFGGASAALQPMAPPAPGYGQPPAPPASPTVAAEAPKKEEAGGDAEARSADPCVVACSALASMTRSAEHVCGLTGDADARCDGARARVRAATERVRARCPSCTDG